MTDMIETNGTFYHDTDPPPAMKPRRARKPNPTTDDFAALKQAAEAAREAAGNAQEALLAAAKARRAALVGELTEIDALLGGHVEEPTAKTEPRKAKRAAKPRVLAGDTLTLVLDAVKAAGDAGATTAAIVAETGIPSATVRRELTALRTEGLVEMRGKNRGARWLEIGNRT